MSELVNIGSVTILHSSNNHHFSPAVTIQLTKRKYASLLRLFALDHLPSCYLCISLRQFSLTNLLLPPSISVLLRLYPTFPLVPLLLCQRFSPFSFLRPIIDRMSLFLVIFQFTFPVLLLYLLQKTFILISFSLPCLSNKCNIMNVKRIVRVWYVINVNLICTFIYGC